MFVDESPDAEVRIIDFGLSQKFAANQHLHDAVGTVYVVWLTFAAIVIFEDSYHLFVGKLTRKISNFMQVYYGSGVNRR